MRRGYPPNMDPDYPFDAAPPRTAQAPRDSRAPSASSRPARQPADRNNEPSRPDTGPRYQPETEDPAATASLFDQYKVYGGKGAIQFSAVLTQKSARPAIMVEGAKSVSERVYDWKDKVALQLNAAEAVELAAVLLGVQPSCAFSGHGPAHDKSFGAENQGDKFFVKIAKKGMMAAVPMGLPDAVNVAMMVIGQIAAGRPGWTRAEVIGLIKTMLIPQ